MSFHHLDDPEGFAPDDSFKAAARADGARRRKRRTSFRRMMMSSISVVLLVGLIGGYVLWQETRIDRVQVAFSAPPVDMTRPFTVLLIGSDQSMLTEHRSQADAIIAVRVDPTARTLTLMTLPGFLVLDGDGEGPPLSEVFRTGGAPGLVDAVQSKLGIPLSAYFQVTFRGLVDMVDAVGGINLSVETTVRDQLDGLNLGASQCAHLDGTEVLEVLRSRHMEVLNPGGDSRTQWIEDRSGDFGREARQRAVLSALVPQLRKLTSSMSGFDAIVSLATDHLTIDSRIGLGGLRALAEWFTSGPSPTGSTAELPVQDHTTSDRHVVLVPAEGAAAAIGSMGGDISTAQALQSGHTPTSIPESAQPFGSCT